MKVYYKEKYFHKQWTDRKIFELDSGEDNPIGKKTTFTMIRESGTEKKKMKTKGDSRKQDNSEDVKFSVEDNIRRRPGLLPASVDNCVCSGTENTTAVQSSCASSQIEKPSKVIDIQDSLERLLLQPISPPVTEQ